MRVVWFKRDLRLADHAPLVEAYAAEDDVLCLYIDEPERANQPDVSALHLAWDLANARSLARSVNELGGTMQLLSGEPAEVLSAIHQKCPITSLYSHQETGLAWSWERDKRVQRWCDLNGVVWHQFPSNGVVRGLSDRDRWNTLRNRRMVMPVLAAPGSLPAHTSLDSVDSISNIQDHHELVNTPLEAGEKAAHAWLNSFLETRFDNYLPTISNPATSRDGSSRLSAYLACGALSVRQVKQRLREANKAAVNNPDFDTATFRKNINAFTSRVSWRCHFVQRLEMESTMDARSINPELDAALERQGVEEHFHAWAEGRTGWPFFDACMRSLKATGWINFRMRAMMQSVAAYTLWLPWQRTGTHLAKLFIDYEPGIHWSQIHMQSGITGINAVRAYSILKQSLDHDQDGDFIRKWVPELAMVPTPQIHEPWTMSEAMQKTTGVIVGETYPLPILDEAEARNLGIKKAYAARRNEEVKARSKAVYTLHGSRKKRTFRRQKTSQNEQGKAEPNPQKSLLDYEQNAVETVNQ